MADRQRDAEAGSEDGEREGQAHTPSYRRKGLLIPLGLVLISAIAAVAAGLGDGDDTGARLFPDRPNAQPEDQERRMGDSVTIGGLRATVTEADVEDLRSLGVTGPGEGEHLVVRVTVENISGQPREVLSAERPLGWHIQLPDGRVQEERFYLLTGEEGLTRPEWDNPELAGGAEVHTQVAFDIADADGDLYILWKPDPSDPGRGVWKASF